MSDSLERILSLDAKEAHDYIWAEPRAYVLKGVPKVKQTYEMVTYVCKNEGTALRHVSKKLIDCNLCEVAVKQNGCALEYVPKRYFDGEYEDWLETLCTIAVSNNGLALRYVPERFMTQSLVETAVTIGVGIHEDYMGIYPISLVPKALLTKDLIKKSIVSTPCSIKDIPKNRITKELFEVAVSAVGSNLQYVPNRLVDIQMVLTAIASDAMAIQYVPDHLKTKEVCEKCFQINPAALTYIPEEFISEEMCLESIGNNFSIKSLCRNGVVCFEDFPPKMRNSHHVLDSIMTSIPDGSTLLIEWNDQLSQQQQECGEEVRNRRGETVESLEERTIEYLKARRHATNNHNNTMNHRLALFSEDNLKKYLSNATLSLPSIASRDALVTLETTGIGHVLQEEDASSSRVYYISDLHLEHQLVQYASSLAETNPALREDYLEKLLNSKIQEMLEGVEDRTSYLLIAGDVSDSVILSSIFYRVLLSCWEGPVISVLGNHELWDVRDYLSPTPSNPQTRPIKSVIMDYKDVVESNKWRLMRTSTGYKIAESKLLENELYVKYKNTETRVLPEDLILDASEKDLSMFLSECSMIILGGIGFSGLNPIYNATMGLYRNAVKTLEEDQRRANHFNAIYKKVRKCAADKKVIVLTHMPVYDWSSDEYNPNWIYVNGHTHQNTMTITEDGIVVLSDNQIGYSPKGWTLNYFSLNGCWYDPFETYSDGVYPITSKEYQDFNLGRGILNRGCNYEGSLYMLKREDLYMFVLQSSKSLCLMIGGNRKRLERNDIQYYYNHMLQYRDVVQGLLEPYQRVMKQLSEEVKRVGGNGNIHGCIVDISFFSHIYVNPFDGKLTAYWALDTLSRRPYDTIQLLLEHHEQPLLKRFKQEYKKNNLPLLESKLMTQKEETEKNMISVPKWMFGNEIYEPSRLMRAIQYVWEQNVIRIWNDEILQDSDIYQHKQNLISGKKES